MFACHGLRMGGNYEGKRCAMGFINRKLTKVALWSSLTIMCAVLAALLIHDFTNEVLWRNRKHRELPPTP